MKRTILSLLLITQLLQAAPSQPHPRPMAPQSGVTSALSTTALAANIGILVALIILTITNAHNSH